MTIEQTPTGELTARISLTLTKDDYEPRVEEALKRYRKQMTMPGFRAGQVPMSVVRKQFGGQVLMEELNNTVNEKLTEHLRESKQRMIGQPLPVNDEPVDEHANEGELTFRFDVGMWPDVAVQIPQGTFTKFQVELDEADIEQQVLRAREYHFRDAYPEESADGDVLIGTAIAAAEGAKKHFITVRTAEIADADLRAKFFGLKKGDQVEVNLEDLFGSNPAELAKALHTSEEELSADFDPNVTFSSNRIMRHGMSDLDQEFFDKVIGPGQAFTEEEFLESFKGLIQAQADKAADDRLMNDILTQTLIENEVPLPEDWVVRTIIEGNKGEEKPSEEEVRAYFHERHAAEMKQSYVTQTLLEQHDMTIGHDDIEERVGEDIRNAYVQYGVEDPDAAMVAKAVTNFLEKENNYDNVVNTLQRERLASILLQHVNVEPQVVSLAEFQSSQANDNEGADVID